MNHGSGLQHVCSPHADAVEPPLASEEEGEDDCGADTCEHDPMWLHVKAETPDKERCARDTVTIGAASSISAARSAGTLGDDEVVVLTVRA